MIRLCENTYSGMQIFNWTYLLISREMWLMVIISAQTIKRYQITPRNMFSPSSTIFLATADDFKDTYTKIATISYSSNNLVSKGKVRANTPRKLLNKFLNLMNLTRNVVLASFSIPFNFIPCP